MRDWQATVQASGIDAVEDLASRPWPCPMAGAVLGVFRAGGAAAAWLVIGHEGSWAVASCADGTVSAPFGSLAGALAAIDPREPAQRRKH